MDHVGPEPKKTEAHGQDENSRHEVSLTFPHCECQPKERLLQ